MPSIDAFEGGGRKPTIMRPSSTHSIAWSPGLIPSRSRTLLSMVIWNRSPTTFGIAPTSLRGAMIRKTVQRMSIVEMTYPAPRATRAEGTGSPPLRCIGRKQGG